MKTSAGFIKRPLQKEAPSILPIPKIFELPLGNFIQHIQLTSEYGLAVSDQNKLWIWGEIREEFRGRSKSSRKKEEAQEIAALLYLSPRQINCNLENHQIVKISCASTNCLMLTASGTVFTLGTDFSKFDGTQYKFNKTPIEVDVLQANNIKMIDITTNDSYSAAISVHGKIYTWGNCEIWTSNQGVILDEEANLKEIRQHKCQFLQIEATPTALFSLDQQGVFYYTGNFENPLIEENYLRKHEVLKDRRFLRLSSNKRVRSIVCLLGEDGNLYVISSDNSMAVINKPHLCEFISAYPFEEGVRAVAQLKTTGQMLIYEWKVNVNADELIQGESTYEIDPLYSRDVELFSSHLPEHMFFTFNDEESFHALSNYNRSNINHSSVQYRSQRFSEETLYTERRHLKFQNNLGIATSNYESQMSTWLKDSDRSDLSHRQNISQSSRKYYKMKKLSFGGGQLDNINIANSNPQKIPSSPQSKDLLIINNYSPAPQVTRGRGYITPYKPSFVDDQPRNSKQEEHPLNSTQERYKHKQKYPMNELIIPKENMPQEGPTEETQTSSRPRQQQAQPGFHSYSYNSIEMVSSDRKHLNQQELDSIPKNAQSIQNRVQYTYYSKESEPSENYIIDIPIGSINIGTPMARLPLHDLNQHFMIPTAESPVPRRYIAGDGDDDDDDHDDDEDTVLSRNKPVASSPQEIRLLNLSKDIASRQMGLSSRELQETQGGTSNMELSPDHSKRSKSSGRDKKWWVEYLKKFSHLHYTKTFTGLQELEPGSESPGISDLRHQMGLDMHEQSAADFRRGSSITSARNEDEYQNNDQKGAHEDEQEYTSQQPMVFLAQSDDEEEEYQDDQDSQYPAALNQRNTSFQLGQAFQSIKQSVPTEETFRQTIYNNKGTLERFVESLQNRVLESYSEGFGGLQSIQGTRNNIIQIEEGYYRDYCQQQRVMGAFHLVKCVKSIIYRIYYSVLLALVNNKCEQTKSEVKLAILGKTLKSINQKAEAKTFYMLKNLTCQKQTRDLDCQQACAIVERVFKVRQAHNIHSAFKTLGQRSHQRIIPVNMKPYIDAALDRVSISFDKRALLHTFILWFQRTKSWHSTRISLDKLIKALKSNELRRKAIGFAAIQKSKGSRIRACQLVWMIFHKYKNINQQYGFQHLKFHTHYSATHRANRNLAYRPAPYYQHKELTSPDQRYPTKDDSYQREQKHTPNRYRVSTELHPVRVTVQGSDSFSKLIVMESKIQNLCETVDEIRKIRQTEALYTIMQFAYTRFLNYYDRVISHHS